MRSAYLDTELMLVIRSKDINKQLEESMVEYERAVSYTHLTNISDIKAFEYHDGVKSPCDGELSYRGYNIKDVYKRQ